MPEVNQRAFRKGAILARMHLDKISNGIIRDKDEKEPEESFDLLETESILSLATFVHETFHYSHDLFCGLGHLLYEIQR